MDEIKEKKKKGSDVFFFFIAGRCDEDLHAIRAELQQLYQFATRAEETTTLCSFPSGTFLLFFFASSFLILPHISGVFDTLILGDYRKPR